MGPIDTRGPVARLSHDPQGYWTRWRVVVRRDPCVYCCALHDQAEIRRAMNPLTVEHVIPKSHSPRPHGWENMAGAHRACNHERGDLSLLFYLLLRMRLTQLTGRANKAARRLLRRTIVRTKTARWRALQRVLDTLTK